MAIFTLLCKYICCKYHTKRNTNKPVVTSIQGSSATFSRSFRPKYRANEHVLRGHLSYSVFFFFPLGDPLRQIWLYIKPNIWISQHTHCAEISKYLNFYRNKFPHLKMPNRLSDIKDYLIHSYPNSYLSGLLVYLLKCA